MADPSAGNPIFLDALSTTPLDRRVLEAMAPYWTDVFANPASTTHEHGRRAADAVEEARASIAGLIGAGDSEIIFTSGATEADNLAILGAARARRKAGRIVSFATEHSAVLDALEQAGREGVPVTLLGVDRVGLPDLDGLQRELAQGDVFLVSAMHANNETGVVWDIPSISRLAHEAGVLFHCDAAQTVGKLPVDVGQLGADLLSLSAHKVYGPKGVGAFYVRSGRPRVRLQPLMFGGGHERGLRSGTLNTPAIAGFAKALEIARDEMDAESTRLAGLRNRLRDRLVGGLGGVDENGDPESRLPHALNVSFEGAQAQTLLNHLPGVAVSTGSACSSADPEPSHVLRAMFGEDERALRSVRFGLMRFTTESEIDLAAEHVIDAVKRVRALGHM